MKQAREIEQREKFGMTVIHDLYYMYLREYHVIPRDIEDLLQGVYCLLA